MRTFLVILMLLSMQLNQSDAATVDPLSLQFLRYEEALNIAKSYSDRLWTEHIPYSDMAIMHFNLVTGEEYLINHSGPDLTKYQPTNFIVNAKTVYKKIGSLTLNYPAGNCCFLVDGAVTMAVGLGDLPVETLLPLILHEGFHFYQSANLVKVGADVYSPLIQAALPSYPRNERHEGDLVVEGKLLYRAGQDVGCDLNNVKKLIAVDTIRKQKQPEMVQQLEDYIFLVEGTAFYVEQKGINLVLAEGVQNSIIPRGSDPQYTYFEGQQIRDLFRTGYEITNGPGILLNKIRHPSTTFFQLNYIYSLAMIRVLEQFAGQTTTDWRNGLFQTTAIYQNASEAKEKFLSHLKEANLSSLMSKLAFMNDRELEDVYAQTLRDELSESKRSTIRDRILIEQNMTDYPTGDGWTYLVVTKNSVVSPNWDFVNVDYLMDMSMTNWLFFAGLTSVQSADQRLTIDHLRIPIKLKMYKGEVIFKDIGHTLADAQIDCRNSSDGKCEMLELKIDGLTLTGKGVTIITDERKKQTTIQFN